VVFDLWNTLAYNHHRPNPIVALGDAFELRGLPGWTKILERGMMLRSLAGIEEGIEAIARLTGKDVGPARKEELARLWRQACGATRFFPEVRPILHELARRYPLGLLSNTQSFDLDFLDGANLPIQARLFSYEMGTLKPDPSLFDRMARALGLPLSALLMVGDNLQDDILGAEAVGMQALLVHRAAAHSLSFQEPHPDRPSLADLLPLPGMLGLRD
jgi:phosphoserine phosphatase